MLRQNKQDNLSFDGEYDADSNKVATVQTVALKIAEIIANAPEKFNTLKELADWLDTHETEAAKMNSAIAELQRTKENKGEITTVNQDKVKLLVDTVEVYEALEDKTNVLGIFTNDPMIANLNAMADGIEANEKAIGEETNRAKQAESKAVQQKAYSTTQYVPNFNDGDCARAYVRSSNGTEDSILVSKYTKAHAIPLRDSAGNLFTLTPTDKNHCANKSYVDDTKKELENSFEDIIIYIKGTDGLQYSLSDDGTYYVCQGIGTAGVTDIIIANIYEGKLVKSIAEKAFSGCSNLKSITIPDSVTSIGNTAFWNCSNLTSITIPNSVTSIGMSIFSKCTKLKSITISNRVTSIPYSAFANCSNLKSITIPDSVTSIGAWAFQNCSNLKSITIPNSVTSIGNDAFNGSTNLTIYCEAESKPSEWHETWNASNCPIVWGTPHLDVFEAAHAMTADFATKDGNGNVISDTYATNAEITDIKNGTITVGKATEANTAKSANSASNLSTSQQNLSITGGSFTRTLTVGKVYALSIIVSGSGRETALLLVSNETAVSISTVTLSGYTFRYSPDNTKITIYKDGNTATGALMGSIREI